MACPGLHCAGCAGGAAVPVVPLAAVFGLAWVAEHIIEVAIVSAVCGALAVAAVVALMRREDRRQASIGSLMVTRAGPPTVTAAAVPQVTPSPVQVIEHHHFVHAITPDPVPAVIRAAIPGQAGDTTTEGN